MPYNLDGTNELYGVFNEERSVDIGDPFNKPHTGLSRHKGKQFGAPWQPTGHGPDGMIDKNTKLSLPGDHYVDPYSLQKDLSARSSIHPKPFVPVGGPKKPCGSGSLHGVFGNPAELVDTDASVGARSGRPPLGSIEHLKNFYINPAKKGTFGYPIQERTIGGTRYDFVPDEYCRGRVVERELRKESRARIPKPFVASGRAGRGITPIKPGGEGYSKPPSQSSAPDGAKPWRQTNPAQKGQDYGTLSRIPYIAAPPQKPKHEPDTLKPFKSPGKEHGRLSMWSVNPYAYKERPPPNSDFTLLN